MQRRSARSSSASPAWAPAPIGSGLGSVSAGRLPSAGTKTVKLRGRARKITFHVFDPHFVEDALNRDPVTEWREQDMETAAENRPRGAWNAKRKRLQNGRGATGPSADEPDQRPQLLEWEDFERTGLP